MKQKETSFLAQECLPIQQNILSPRFDELIPICSSENALEQPFEVAITKKRNIFEKQNFRALNDGHKSQDSEIEQNQSKASENDFCIDSYRSRANSFDNQLKSPNIVGKDYENQITPFRRGLTGQNINSTLNLNYQNVKSLSKIDQYQSFVQKIEQEEDNIQKQEQYEKYKSSETREQNFQRTNNRREGTIGLNEIWAQKGLSIIRLVSRFIQQLKTKTETIKFRLITQKIFSVIGDLSSNFEYILISRQIKQKPSLLLIFKYNFQKSAMKYLHYLENLQEFLSKNIIVIRPDSKFKILWDIILLLFIVMNIFYIPINISFNVTTSGAFEYLFDLLPSWIFVAEIIINFNTAYYDKGLMHEDRKSIVKHYLKGNFFWDLLIVIPFLISQLNIPYVRYSLLIRLTRLQPLMESIEEMLNLEENLQIVVDLFKLIFFLVLTGHFCGCAWHFVALTEYESFQIQHTWLTDYEPNAFQFHWFDRYIISLYWSVITTVTVGYGDIIPVTTFERIFVIIVTFLLCGVFGYSISNIGNIFKQLSEKKSMYKFKLRQIHSHIRKRGLNLNLSLKVKKYFEYYFQLEQEEENHADEFLSQLTKHLREEVLTDLYSNTLKKSRFLRDNFNEITINNLCQFVKEKKILPEEVLYSRFEQPKKLWFILSGSLEFVADHKNENDYFEATETFLKKVSQGAVLGEREFITQQSYQYKVRALKFTQLAYIEYEDFLNVIAENDEEYERFCMKRDRLLFNPGTKGCGNICEICEWTHNFIQCPFIFLQPNINKIANKFTSVRLNKRIKFPFRHKIKYRTKDYLNQVQEEALKIIVGNQNEQEFTDEYLISLGFQLSPYLEENEMIEDLESQSNMNDSKSPTLSDKDYKKELNKRNTKTQLGLTTDLKESRDMELGSQMRKSIINFKRIQFGKERTKAFQLTKKENNEKGIEQQDNQQILAIPYHHHSQNKFSMIQNIQKARKSQNFDDFGLIQVSQKFNCVVQQQLQQQQEQDSKCYMKSSSKYSETSEKRQQSILKRQDSIKQKQLEYNDMKQTHIGEHRRKKRKTTINQQQNVKRRSYQHQQSGLSPVLQQVQQQQQQIQQMQQVLKRGSQFENQKKLGQITQLGQVTQQLTSSGMIEYTTNDQIKDNNLIDSLQQRIYDIVHTKVEFQIDKCTQSLVYFPEFNIEEVLKKIEKFYLHQRGIDKKSFRRSKSNRNLFERIKPIKNITIKSILNTNKSQSDIQN